MELLRGHRIGCPRLESDEATCTCLRIPVWPGTWPAIPDRIARELFGFHRLEQLLASGVLELAPGGFRLVDGAALK